MEEKEKLLDWLKLQTASVKFRRFITEGGVDICNLSHVNDREIFVYNAAELARIIGAELQIESRKLGGKFNSIVYFMYDGIKIYDLFQDKTGVNDGKSESQTVS